MTRRVSRRVTRRWARVAVTVALALAFIAGVNWLASLRADAAAEEPGGVRYVRTTCIQGSEVHVLSDGSIIPLPAVCER